jgi:dipeptidyl-peptidase-4
LLLIVAWLLTVAGCCNPAFLFYLYEQYFIKNSMRKRFSFFAFLALTLSVNAQNKIQLEDIITSSLFRPQTIQEVRSMNNGEYYTVLEHNAFIVRYKYTTGLPADTLFSLVSFRSDSIPYIASYEFNADETKILVSTNVEQRYRHSYEANYYVYNIGLRSLTPVSSGGKQELATFSPGSDKIAFVRQNNIYISNLSTNKETQITLDGKKNEIINGAPDWVYEEEFSFSKGFQWSPDGRKLAFMKFNESQVKTYTIPVYDSLYPSLYTYKYPKAGEKNSVVSIYVYNIATGKTKLMNTGMETDQYIPRTEWTKNPDKLAIIRLNRQQNKVDLLIANAETGQSETIYSETNKCYISEIEDHTFTFLQDGRHFLVFSERDGYKHLYLYTMDGKPVNLVTPGNYDVDELLGINQEQGIVYYTSTELSTIDRMVYSIKLNGKDKRQVSTKKGTNKAEFSNNYKYFINTWSDGNTPPQYTLHETGGKQIRVLEDNNTLQNKLVQYKFGTKEFINLPASPGVNLNAYIIKPTDFDSTKKYPLFMFVYGGPESQSVIDGWDRDFAWFQMLAQKGFIVACADNRGTNGRGEAFRKCTYKQLGKLEVEDQMNAARYFGKLTYIDKNRIGIFGWSYGGYMASLCMTRGADLFKLGIAVAPVTNWRFYDSVYTERFMGTPQENPSGYDDNSPINFANMLKGKFLIIHGSADDNVHLQNTMVFTEKLIQAGKSFDMAIYPDKNHSIYGGKTRLNLYGKMTDFVINNL